MKLLFFSYKIALKSQQTRRSSKLALATCIRLNQKKVMKFTFCSKRLQATWRRVSFKFMNFSSWSLQLLLVKKKMLTFEFPQHTTEATNFSVKEENLVNFVLSFSSWKRVSAVARRWLKNQQNFRINTTGLSKSLLDKNLNFSELDVVDTQ